MNTITFSDVSTHWARHEIYFLTSHGILQGYSDGTFKPEANVTVGEFCKMAVHAANVTRVINDGGNYDNWARRYINYIKGEKGILLHPGDQLTEETTVQAINTAIQRQFAFSVAWHIVAAGWHERHDYNADQYNMLSNPDSAPFSDRLNVLPHNREGVFQLIRNGIVHGYPNNTLGPAQPITRAEASRVIALCIASPRGLEMSMHADRTYAAFGAASGAYCDVPVAASNMPDDSPMQFEVMYDTGRLEAEDLCLQAAGRTLAAGNVAGTDVNITRFNPSDGIIRFTYTGAMPSPGHSDMVNAMRFRALNSGRHTVVARKIS